MRTGKHYTPSIRAGKVSRRLLIFAFFSAELVEYTQKVLLSGEQKGTICISYWGLPS